MENLPIDKSWTLFLDRDGVINRRIVGGYVARWEEFEFLPGVTEALVRFPKLFGRIVIVSNQQGVGKGLMTSADVDRIHSSMVRQLEGEGARIDLVLFCPDLESEGSEMRKPRIGMALEAQRQFPAIRFDKSVMAGDMKSDMLFGQTAGMHNVLISNDQEQIAGLKPLYEQTFPDLLSYALSLSPIKH